MGFHSEPTQMVQDSFDRVPSVVQGKEQSEYILREPLTPDFAWHSGLFFGLMMMLLIVNLLFYFNLRDNIYLYYLFLVFMNVFVLAYHEGLLYPYVWNRFFRYDVDMGVHALHVLSGYLFSRNFIEIHHHYKRIDHLLQSILAVALGLYLCYFIDYQHVWIERADNVGVSFFLLMWLLNILFFKKEPRSKIAFIAYGVVIIAGFLHIVLEGVPNIPLIGHSTNLVKIGMLIEALILSYATAYRTRLLMNENIEMKVALKSYITSSLQPELISNDSEQPNSEPQQKLETLIEEFCLTDREASMLLHIVGGLNNKQIAEELCISVNTVKYHIKKLYEKLQINKRSEIMSKYILQE